MPETPHDPSTRYGSYDDALFLIDLLRRKSREVEFRAWRNAAIPRLRNCFPFYVAVGFQRLISEPLEKHLAWLDAREKEMRLGGYQMPLSYRVRKDCGENWWE